MARGPFHVLLVDDDEGSAFLFRQVIGQAGIEVDLHTACNGKEALAFLRREAPHGAAPMPHLVLLDINMPVMNGHEMLADLVADPRLKGLPVVVFTTSASERDIEALYGLRCSSYIVKPKDLEGFERAVKLLYEYWFTVASLPGRPL